MEEVLSIIRLIMRIFQVTDDSSAFISFNSLIKLLIDVKSLRLKLFVFVKLDDIDIDCSS